MPHELCSAPIAMEVCACMQRPQDFWVPCFDYFDWNISLCMISTYAYIMYRMAIFIHRPLYFVLTLPFNSFICSFFRLCIRLLIHALTPYSFSSYLSSTYIPSSTNFYRLPIAFHLLLGRCTTPKALRPSCRKRGAISNQHRNDRQTLNNQNSEVNCVEMNGMW